MCSKTNYRESTRQGNFLLIKDEGGRRRSGTVVFLTVHHLGKRLVVFSFITSSALDEKSKFLGSVGSMVARLKLEGIDGRAPPGVELAG